MSRTVSKPVTILFTALLLLVFAMPQLAFADDGLTAGAVQDGEEEQAEPAAHVMYRGYAAKAGAWKQDGAANVIPQGKYLAKLEVKAEGDYSGSIQYKAYVNGFGWQVAKKDGSIAGAAKGTPKTMGAVRISLTGEISQYYDVLYRVKKADGVWQDWRSNGQLAGKVGTKLRGVQVKLQAKKKSASAGVGIVSVNYRFKAKSAKWSRWLSDGQQALYPAGKRLQALRLNVDTGKYNGHIQYRLRLSNGKWKAWKKDGASTGYLKNVEAVQIKLTGSIAKYYDVVYQTYVSRIGWQARVRNGATAGTAKGRRIEGIKVTLVSKSKCSGWVGSGNAWSYYKNGKKVRSKWINTTESPINVMTAKSKRYWLDANGKLAVARIVDPKTELDAGSGKAYYASDWGYVRGNVKLQTSKGIALVGKGGALVSKAGWLETDIYDDALKRYYLKSNGSFAIVQEGFFKVSGKRYYGEPGRGYIMQDTTKQINGKWYTADAEGVVGDASTTQALIERYVQWAVAIANDNSHGYSQDLSLRWGPDYDCSSLVISALKNTGLSVGAAVYTGNMISELTARGFYWHTDMSNIRRGDILLVHNSSRQHTEIYLGKGKTVGAHIAETGGIYGVSGDQTGEEICIAPYYNIWEGYLRLGS